MAVASLVARVDAQTANAEKGFANIIRTVREVEKNFANTASSVTAQQKQIEKAFTSFSGDRLAREASAVAKAVEQIGGASKLTATEQARVNATVTEAISKYGALGQQAPKSLTDLAAATAKLEPPISLASRAAGFLAGTFSQFTAANLAASAIQGLIGGVGEFVAEAKRLPAIEMGFERLAKGVQQNSGEMLGAMRGASRGLVSDLDLMQAANKALLLGLPVTAGEMGNLASTATALGRAMGLDAKQSFDDLITALGRSSPLILDNLGLTVKVGEANEAYAKTLGRTADSLTDAERKSAFYVAAMEAARKKTAELGEQTLTLSERLSTVWTAVGNRVTGTVAALDSALGRVLSSGLRFGQFLQDVISRGPGFAIAMQQAGVVVDEFAQRARTAPLPTLAPGALARESAIYREELEATAKAYEASKRAAADYAQSVKGLRDQITGASVVAETRRWADALQTSGLAATVLADDHLRDELGGALDAITRKFGSLKAAGLGSLSGIQAALKAMRQQAETIPPKIAETIDVFSEVASGTRDWARENRITTGTLLEMVNTGRVFKDEISGKIFKQMREDGQVATTSMRTLASDMQFAGQIAVQFGAQLHNSFGTIVSSIGSAIQSFDALKRAGKDAYAQIATAASGAMQVATSSGGSRTQNVAGAAAGGFATGAAIGSFFPGAGTAIGGGIGAGVGALVGFFRQTRDYKDAKAAVAAFEQQLASTFTATERLAVGNEGWRLTAMAVGDAYSQAGKSSAEAEAAVKRLWESSKKGGDEAALSILEIQAVLEQAAQKQREMEAKAGDSAKAMEDSIAEATAGVRGRIADLASEYDSLFKSIQNEAPEEVMGQVETNTRARMDAVRKESEAAQREQDDITKRVKDGFTEIGPAAQGAAKDIEDAFKDVKITIPIKFVTPDGSALPGDSSRTLSFDSGSGIPDSTPTSADTFGAGGDTIVVKLNLDGREAAEAVVPHIPGVVRRRG